MNVPERWEQTIEGAREFVAVSRTLGGPVPTDRFIELTLSYLSSLEPLGPVNVQCSLSDDGSIDIDASWPDPMGGFRIAKTNIANEYIVVFTTKAGFLTAFETDDLPTVVFRLKDFCDK